jgi:hypothetical protein
VTCYQCTRAAGQDAAVVAICQSCGALLCADHVVERAVTLTAVVGMGRHHSVWPPARILRCPGCDAAEQARARKTG